MTADKFIPEQQYDVQEQQWHEMISLHKKCVQLLLGRIAYSCLLFYMYICIFINCPYCSAAFNVTFIRPQRHGKVKKRETLITFHSSSHSQWWVSIYRVINIWDEGRHVSWTPTICIIVKYFINISHCDSQRGTGDVYLYNKASLLSEIPMIFLLSETDAIRGSAPLSPSNTCLRPNNLEEVRFKQCQKTTFTM